MFKKISRILTPVQTKKPILSYRNIMALFNAIFNTHEDWMDKQDPFEFANRDNSYQRRIWKYKLMINKLHSDVPEALTQSSKGEWDLLENVTKEQLANLSETEKEQYILRHNKLGASALFRGKSLCLNIECVKKINRIFECLYSNFFHFV